MPKSKKVVVERRFQRSIRIDTDLDDPNSLHGFICPSSFSSVLTTIAEHVRESKQGAFTWTGPFGGGKSSLALVFASLLSGDRVLRKTAMSLTGEAGKTVESALEPGKLGYRTLAVVGRKENAVDLLLEAMKREKHLYRESKKSDQQLGRRVLESLDRASKHENHAGLVVFIDELGKVLEAAAEGKGDLHFLQELAELASRSEGRLIVIGILHQSFSEYTGRLAVRARDEWMKIQGRFVDIPLSMAADEQLAVLAKAITANPPKSATTSANKVGAIVDANRKKKKSEIRRSLLGCWPLNPITAALLGPYSRRRFGQNQRSIFSFLNSAEPHGFQAFLNSREDLDVYIPLMFWDYLRANVEPSIMASSDSHRWSTALDAVERCEAKGGESDHVVVTKTLAIIEQFREQAGFYPTAEIIALAIPSMSKNKVDACLSDLQEWSIVAYRRHIDSYAIYAGSDFNIDNAIEVARSEHGVVDVATLNRLSVIKPVMAMRHYHETGALRWMSVHVVPLEYLEKTIRSFDLDAKTMGHFVIVLPSTEFDDKETDAELKRAYKQSGPGIVLSMAQNGHHLNDLALELLIAEQLQENTGELSGDAVARREVESRITEIRSQFNFALQTTFLSMNWVHKGKKFKLAGRAKVSQFASKIADDIFSKSPKISNELLNREKLSSSAMRARRLLLSAMVANRQDKRLGFEGYPAEAALYDSVLADTGLHRKGNKAGSYQFDLPKEDKDLARLRPLWQAADEVLAQASTNEPKSMADVYAVWRAAPYGIREGMLVVFGLAYLLSPKPNIAVYLDGLYRPVVDDFVADRLHQEPGAIALRQVEFSAARSKVLKKLANIASAFTPEEVSGREPLKVAQILVAQIMNLPQWTLRTRMLSPEALKLRSIVTAANDPNRFLFDDLSQLVQLTTKGNEEQLIGQEIASYKAKDIDAMVEVVSLGLNELSDAYSAMLAELKALLESELQFKNTKSGLKELYKRANNIVDLTGDFRLDAFATRLKTYDDSDASIESIASLAANKPARDWVDRDLDAARIEIAEMSQRFKRGETFARVKNREESRHSLAFVVGLGGDNQTLIKEFDVGPSEIKKIEKVEKQLRNVLINDSIDREIMLAAMARIGAELIDGRTAEATSE